MARHPSLPSAHPVHLAPMSDVDRDAFIDRWHRAVAAELKHVGRPADELPETAKALKVALRETPAIARLATNPLLVRVDATAKELFPPRSLADAEALAEMGVAPCLS